MHEIGYCEALLPVVERRAGGRRVTRIGIRAGVRHRLVADVMQTAWAMTATGTLLAAAETVMEQVAIEATCLSCDNVFDTDDTLAECPSCGDVGARLRGGDEFVLAWLEYDDERRESDEQVLAAPAHGGH